MLGSWFWSRIRKECFQIMFYVFSHLHFKLLFWSFCFPSEYIQCLLIVFPILVTWFPFLSVVTFVFSLLCSVIPSMEVSLSFYSNLWNILFPTLVHYICNHLPWSSTFYHIVHPSNWHFLWKWSSRKISFIIIVRFLIINMVAGFRFILNIITLWSLWCMLPSLNSSLTS